MKPPAVFDRPADFAPINHAGRRMRTLTALISPAPSLLRDDQPARFFAVYPDPTRPTGQRAASTLKPPLLCSPNGYPLNGAARWDAAVERARQWRVSPELLFVGRPLRLAISFAPDERPWPGGGGPRDFAVLRGVEVGGDFDKFPALDEAIAEAKGWFKP